MIQDVIVTGASGYLGGRVCRQLVREGYRVTTLVRPGSEKDAHAGTRKVRHDLMQGPVDCSEFDLMIHCAGEVRPSDPNGDIAKSVNVRLAENAVRCRAKRLLVISSIAASVAEVTPRRANRYGYEKLAAEYAIRNLLRPGQDCVFLRPPAIYGPMVDGPLATLAALIRRGTPLPLAWAHTPRPYLSSRNFESLISAIVAAPDQTWAAAHLATPEPHDGMLISTRSLCQHLARSMKRKSSLFGMPNGLLRLGGWMTGRSALISSALDAVPIRYGDLPAELWGWTPLDQMPDSLTYLRSQ